MLKALTDEEVVVRNKEIETKLCVGTIFTSQYLDPHRVFCRMIVAIYHMVNDKTIYNYEREIKTRANSGAKRKKKSMNLA
jgi:hypothetical protein